MKLSSYFHPLRSAYQAELDDLLSDSEGKDVLRKRLAEKRKEMSFLVLMIEAAPEMVAVVFHRGFRFAKPAVMERLVGLSPEALPAWDSLSAAVALEPWAVSLEQAVLAQPEGSRFMVVAACLEYLQHHAHLSHGSAAGIGEGAADAEEEDERDAAEHDDDYNALSADDLVDAKSHRARDEDSANWLSDIGFDRKD